MNNVNIYFNEVNGFDFVNATPYYNNYILAYGLYKISVIGGSRKGFFYLDYRDANFRTYSVPIGSDIDVWFIYDGIEDRFGFRRYNCGITNNPELFINIENGQILRIWDIKEQNSLFSPNNQLFPAFWSNALVLVSDKFNHPKIAWGPYQEIAMSVQNYRIYKKKGTSDFNYLTSTTNLEFVDVNEVIPTQPSSQVSVYYYVRAYGQISESYYESIPSNTVGINVKGGFDKTNNDYYPIVNINNNLNQNYPNPFNPNTVINYAVKEAGLVKLKVYDILGAEVAELVRETKEAGYHSTEFNASQLPSGVYIYTLQANGFTSSKKMLLMK